MSTPYISDFSPHLFWDVNPDSLDMEKHKKYIIGRTLDYGLIDDWRLIRTHYGIETIAQVATEIKDLSPKSRALVSNLSGVPKEKFRCYITRQSNPLHWNF
jgi:hypothetical protein